MLKKDQNKENIVDNHRLITLLNANLKILVKVISERLALVIEKLTDMAQICTTLDRSIHDMIHRMYKIIDRIINERGIGGLVIDFGHSKAFKRVDCRYLEVVITVARVHLVSLHYSHKLSSVRNTMRSVSQVCPFSLLLYVLTLEALLRKLATIRSVPREL